MATAVQWKSGGLHRRVAVFEREEQGVVLDHLLEEVGFDRLVGAADVGVAEVVERRQRRDRDDHSAGDEGASARWRGRRD